MQVFIEVDSDLVDVKKQFEDQGLILGNSKDWNHLIEIVVELSENGLYTDREAYLMLEKILREMYRDSTKI